MGSNGIVTENAQHSIDKEKFDEGWNRIFGDGKKAAKTVPCTTCFIKGEHEHDTLFTIIDDKFQVSINGSSSFISQNSLREMLKKIWGSL